MRDRDEFEKWFTDNHEREGVAVDLTMKAYMWAGWQAARTKKADESTKQRAETCDSIFNMLDEVTPERLDRKGTGKQCAMHAIRELAERAGLAQQAGSGEAVAFYNPATERDLQSGSSVLVRGEKADGYTVPPYTHPKPAQQGGVPEVATEEMLEEGVTALSRGLKAFGGNYTQVVSNIWEDMLAAANPPAEGAG